MASTFPRALRRRFLTRTITALGALVLAGALGVAPSPAEAQMPDLRAMSGKPLPAADLPAGTITVRVARQIPANAVPGVEVTAEVTPTGGEATKRTATTGADGRATFEALPAGASFQARLTVDGEALESARFAVPGTGGARLMIISGLGASGEQSDEAGGQAPAQGGGDTFQMGAMTGTVEPASDLPKGTLELTLLDRDGKPIVGRRVLLGEVRLKATAPGAEPGREVEAHPAVTDDQGRARYTDLPTGEAAGYAAVAEHEGSRISTTPFRMPDTGGMRGTIRALGRTGNAGSIRLDSRSQFVFAPAEEAVAVVVDLVFRNPGQETFDPGPEGFLYPLPEGFVNAEGLSGSVPIEAVQGKGVRIKTSVPPDSLAQFATRARFVYFLRSGNSGEVEVAMPMPYGLDDPLLLIQEKTGLSLAAEGLRHTRDAEGMDGGKLKLYTVPAIAPGGTLRVTVKNLPTRGRTGHYAATALCLALVVAAVLFARAPRAQGAAAARQTLVDRREKLFADLVAVEQERRSGKGEATLDDRRRDLIGKLEAVYRDLGRLEAEG